VALLRSPPPALSQPPFEQDPNGQSPSDKEQEVFAQPQQKRCVVVVNELGSESYRWIAKQIVETKHSKTRDNTGYREAKLLV
jgi:hypothetical protein